MKGLQPPRDHLFISYAIEQSVLARWLTLRLTSEGYRVWCDQFKLLGGESFPRDIDDAIRRATFRVIALISKESLKKPNATKERTLALNLSRDRNENFLIPIITDATKPVDLNWMLADLTYISFQSSWAAGLARLLKNLRASNAPINLDKGAGGCR